MDPALETERRLTTLEQMAEDNLRYQRRQNGAVERLADSFEQHCRENSASLGALKSWLIGILGTLVASLVLLIVNLVVVKPG